MIGRLFCMLVVTFGLLGCAAKGPVAPPGLTEQPQWGAVFEKAGVRGTLVLKREGDPKTYVFDSKRAATGYLPASTFKIMSALIALETGVADGPEALFAWDGVTREVPAWNQNLSLRRAFQVSAVPVFQVIARRIGPERMSWYVRASRYGNATITGAPIDAFWLEGSLRISALQQVNFLSRLYRDRLPFSSWAMDIVKDMMAEKGPDYVFRTKTGLLSRNGHPELAWWVGWLERGGDVWHFALNIDVDKPEQVPQRKLIVLEVLRMQGLMPQ
ncbi:OXA-48 family carbapenem-hydrolyzing class D beta-lactamase OXA-54 [Fundidesulfovibrio butyratiphilus]